ncbi:MAG: hypothetical protein CME38_16935 [Haliea sp.]|nr:hypothetical protein [Haliea sp.]
MGIDYSPFHQQVELVGEHFRFLRAGPLRQIGHIVDHQTLMFGADHMARAACISLRAIHRRNWKNAPAPACPPLHE